MSNVLLRTGYFFHLRSEWNKAKGPKQFSFPTNVLNVELGNIHGWSLGIRQAQTSKKQNNNNRLQTGTEKEHSDDL